MKIENWYCFKLSILKQVPENRFITKYIIETQLSEIDQTILF